MSDNAKKKAEELGVPLIEPLPEIPFEINPTIAVCGQCSLELKQVMGYVCNNYNCPIQLRIR